MAQLVDLCLVILVVFLMEANADDSRLCTYTEWVTKSRLVSEPYTVQYRKKPCFFKCTRTRMEYRSKIERLRVPIMKLECCKGYSENGTMDILGNVTPVCKPNCERDCGEGVCVSPDKCTCQTGYTFSNGTCLPVCSAPCDNGTCVEPETCKCFPGYKMTDVNVCTPVCSKGCHNGSCISPEVCQCEDGWELVNETTCVPKCDISCKNGTCIAPNTCKCNTGYVSSNGSCLPVCSQPCDYGTCVEPETCQCFPGYKMTDVNVCTPVCSKGCHNGSCISPEVCQCEDGWELVNETTCVPKCDIFCINGTCIAPNTCKCNTGYVYSNGSCLPVCSQPCDYGTCVEPEICKCVHGYKMSDVNVCTPVCSKGCHNGSCISPEVCQCEHGWELVNETTCVPKCDIFCNNGTCIAPNTCKCNLGYDLKNGLCQPVCSKTCYDGHCVDMCNTLDQDDVNFTINHIEFDNKVSTKKEMTTFTVPYHGSINGTVWGDVDENDVDLELITNLTNPTMATFEESHRSFLNWIYYYVIPGLALIMIITTILIWKRKSIAEYCTGGSYVVAGDQKNSVSNDKIPDIRLSSIMEKKTRKDTNGH